MADINNVVNQTQLAGNRDDQTNSQSQSTATSEPTPTVSKEKNYTDPKVCHDPSMTPEGIAKIFFNQHKVEMEEGEISANNNVDALRVDGRRYPLLVINDRDIDPHEILDFVINYDSFVPTIRVTIYDEEENEQKINSTQMSGMIRTCIIATVDNVYKKILLNFKITSSSVDPYEHTRISYTGEYYVPLFKQTNLGHIWMPEVCPKSPTCMQGAHINANTWEMLHKVAEMSGLGFAATKQCKEISDRLVRHTYMQRFDEFLKRQILHCGLTEQNIFDVWVDLYGYIVQVNVPWVLSQDISSEDLTIVTTVGFPGTSNNVPDQTPEVVERTLTNYNQTGAISNMEILEYNLKTSNHAVSHGTLEHVFIINFVGTKTEMEETDVQTKQNSVDGQYLEDYNTGKNHPIPKFNFNIDEYTELAGGYDLDHQKVIREAFFRKHRQSILEVKLKYVNLGLQRGTLVNIVIFEDKTILKDEMIKNANNLGGSTDVQSGVLGTPPNLDEQAMTMSDGTQYQNLKLSGLYYIDGMRFEYNIETQEIYQTLILFKKGIVSGYQNRHSVPKLPLHKIEKRTTLPQSPPFIETYKGNIH